MRKIAVILNRNLVERYFLTLTRFYEDTKVGGLIIA